MEKLKSIRAALTALAFAITSLSVPSHAGDEPLTVFAAASLKDTLEAIGKVYTEAGGGDVRFSFASSSVLAKQIEAGSVADVFASADLKWMDYLDDKNLIKRETRMHLLGNILVFVAPIGSPLVSLELQSDHILRALGDSRIATGDTASVPVGVYAKSALQNLGLWDSLQSRLALSDNVRSALAFVSRKEAPLGIVYETDARAEKSVKIVASIPEKSHEQIVYPFAITTSSAHTESEKFLTFLRSEKAISIFKSAGFPIIQ